MTDSILAFYSCCFLVLLVLSVRRTQYSRRLLEINTHSVTLLSHTYHLLLSVYIMCYYHANCHDL